MNKRHRKLEKHRQLFLFRCIGDSSEYDTYYGFTVAARDPEHAVRVIFDGCTFHVDTIKERLESALDSGLPIPKEYKHHLTQEMLGTCVNDPVKWHFEKVSRLPDLRTPDILGASYNAG